MLKSSIVVLLMITTLSEPARAGDASGSCQRRVNKVAPWLQSLTLDYLTVEPADAKLVRTPGKAALKKPGEVVMTIGPRGMSIGWDRVANARTLKHVLQKYSRRTQKGKPRLVLALDEGAKSAIVFKQLLRDAGKLIDDRVVLLFSAPVPVAPPPASTVTPQLLRIASAPPSERAQKLSLLISQTIRPCKAMIEVFAAISSASPEQRHKLLVQGTLKALPACNCAIDLASIKSIFYVLKYLPTSQTASRATCSLRKLAKIRFQKNKTWAVTYQRALRVCRR